MWDQELFKRALDFAAKAHGDQKVPGSGLPYVVHVVKVATEVLRACEEEQVGASLAMPCALLHDTLEDAAVTYEALAQEFGEAVASGVRALSKDEGVPKDERMADSLRRIRLEPREVWLVKLGDRITNLEPPPSGWGVSKRRAYLAEAGVIHAALGEASPYLAARLEAKMRAYERHCG